ncbi:WbqC family protein [Acrocarpospora macrocephala]|uniref:WbqC family protein n=1 Tax=Acrocarpospora macrocephala TaxID=150177 RepID=A0A5M3WFG9_9ACTN|nr:WbqC family protein [Acrocarpospora macrocephala]GES07010.1 hypothetical protein Amac_006050 [Acrocarpospora macrocephala]
MAAGLLCAIHQPNFFPRLSTLAKLFTADVWVVLDDVQFTRRDYQHRCRLTAPGDTAGESAGQWLTIPVHLPDGQSTRIRDVRIADPAHTRRRVTRLLQQYYRRSPHWAAAQTPLQEVLDAFDRTDRLADLSQAATMALLTVLGWPGVIWRSSDLPARTGRSERLADLTCAVGATTYLCGTGGARYLDQWPFATHGLTTKLFTTPVQGDPRIWSAARRVTALTALMGVGPAALTRELCQHATHEAKTPPHHPATV